MSDTWTTSLDDDDSAPASASDAATESPRPRAWLAAAAVLAATGALAVLLTPARAPSPKNPPPPAVLGSHLPTPLAWRAPPGAIVTADKAYLGVRVSASAHILVSAPTSVMDPSGQRAPLPADLPAWLQDHPGVFVSRSRVVRVRGQDAVQLDYRRSDLAFPQSRFARLPLLCGWEGTCAQITSDARVRATFVQVDGRIVVLEALWRPGQGSPRTMPADLREAYSSLIKAVDTA